MDGRPLRRPFSFDNLGYNPRALRRPLLPPVTSVLDLIGNTPIVQLTHINPAIFVKLEYLNPGGSVKDRIGTGMIERAERAGLVKKGGTIIEPTAGNTGIGLALAGVQMGYRVILCVPENFSMEKREVMKALGGEVHLTPKDDGMKGAIAKAEELQKSIPNAYIPQQFVNVFNTESHYETTGPEIYEQMEGRVDGYIAGAGTGGTFTGVAKYLRERLPKVYCAVVEPQGSILKGGEAGPHEVEGIGASTFIPPVLDLSLANDIIQVHDEPAFAMVKRLAREEGILAGGSGGANVEAAVQVAAKLGPKSRVVTLIPDAAERYMSKGIFTKWAK